MGDYRGSDDCPYRVKVTKTGDRDIALHFATTRVLSTKPFLLLADDTLGRSNSRASDSALDQKCPDICFKVGAVYDTDICGGDAYRSDT